ncbi:MAG TPA: AAA family ATPase, partial [Actinoplanes sp.]|nr:AAA family ATPase [Actinoplanes sp.]
RLAGVAGVAQLAPEAPADPAAVVLTDVGRVSLARLTTPVPAEEVVGLGLGLARTVAGMHARAVLHRNICPANIMLDRDGAPCLVGFGQATAVAEVRPEFTHPSQIVGELAYLAPEQTGRTGRAVDERADLYALGATLYELATGAPPFGSGDPLRLLHDHVARVPTSPNVMNPAIPGPLSEIIGHLLEKEPDHRYQTAEGLVYDLQRLRDAGGRPAADFQVGARDVPVRLLPPSRLVSRDDEIAALEAAFDGALAGECRGVLVGGVPGVGKTALIDQLRPVVTGRDGWYVAGKFDQYRRDMEFDGVAQAMRALARLLLAEPEDELAEVRARILRALGPNAGLLTAGGTEVAAVLAVPPDPGDLLTAQARVQWAGVQMLRAVASRKRPVLMFLDDLQWAGRTPLGFMDLVLRGDPVDGLLLIGAYRDSEVDAAHPLAPMLDRWRRQDGVRQLGLDDLPVPGVAAIVADMLHLDHDRAAGLAGLIAGHTRGNPYETMELLNALRQGGMLTQTTGGWRWDEATVRAYLDAADPAGLSAGRVATLPARSRQVVRAMACLGGRAEPDLLATATGIAPSVVEQHLAPAMDEGLLVAEPGTPAAVRFRHDRIREAVLAGLAPPRRRKLHLAMARRLADVSELFAVAAEQYLPAVDAVTEAGERRRVVGLLRRAAEQAGLIGDYVLVSALLGAAVQLVDPSETGTLLEVRTARHAALFSAGRLDEADEEYRATDALGPTVTQRADATVVQVYSLSQRNRGAEAVSLGVTTLQELGIAVAVADEGEDLDRRFKYLHRWLERTGDADEPARPEITDPALLATTRLLDAIPPVAYVAGDYAVFAWVGLEALRIWLDHGSAPALVGPASCAAVAAALRGDGGAGYQALRRILTLGEARGYEPGTSQARFLYAAQTWRFGPIEDGVDAARRAREGLIVGGDVANAGYTYLPAVTYLLDCGPTLDAVAAEARAGLAFTRRAGNEQTGQLLESYRWLTGILRTEGSVTAQPIFADRYAGNPPAALHARLARAVVAAVLGDAAGLARHTAAAMPLLSADLGAYATALVRLLRGLAIAEQARSADGDDRRSLLTELDELTGWLAARAADAPANFAHLVRLLEAERAWAVGDFPTAELAFDAALREVDQRQRPWHRALITEHAARFYLARGCNHFGHRLLADARAHYAAWGATAKVTQLDWAYPTLHPAAAATIERDHDPLADQQPARTTTATTVTSGTIDLLGILTASQALSSETTLDHLHTRVADTLAAVTGATGVHLLLWSEDQRHWLTPTPGGTTPIATGQEHTVPMTVLRYLHRTGEPLLVADATTDDRFARDPYFTDLGHCALLAVPIHSRGALRAVLLLENRLLRGAFTADRLDAVTLIAGQLAVSLDNANLYAELTASRTRIVATADTTRKHIERDLHDGAQQHLVSLALQLRLAQTKVRTDQPDLATALEHAATEAHAATQELREIAQGLHPSILSSGGLGPALRSLARRAPIPVDLDLSIDRRLPEPVEVSAYYIVAEALTNIAKYAEATTATITVEPDPTHNVLDLTVTDDGVGGADLTRGTGLLGLKDRAEALGGHLTLHSPPGTGTRLHAELPLTISNGIS